MPNSAKSKPIPFDERLLFPRWKIESHLGKLLELYGLLASLKTADIDRLESDDIQGAIAIGARIADSLYSDLLNELDKALSENTKRGQK